MSLTFVYSGAALAAGAMARAIPPAAAVAAAAVTTFFIVFFIVSGPSVRGTVTRVQSVIRCWRKVRGEPFKLSLIRVIAAIRLSVNKL
ncbi:hypothetical protein GCM10023353_29770 [Tomitella cavernea]|uniref:Secreted protein n=1 Tax=Tomitella cavernea TaxID=1387982 RepID=A0ABP9CW23_9ACTN